MSLADPVLLAVIYPTIAKKPEQNTFCTHVKIETTGLYRALQQAAKKVTAGPPRLLDEFERLREIVQEHGKYIVLIFPEYTPHDHTRHLDHLFGLADRLLGKDLYERLRPSEIVVLAFALYAHDWGMAVSAAERKVIETGENPGEYSLLPNEPSSAREFIAEQIAIGITADTAWRDYLRQTHGLRSGARLRKYLEPLGDMFGDAVAKAAEGHTLDMRTVRDYPYALPLYGETVNLSGVASYIRLVDLLDIGEDRTPYALWKFVGPADPISKLEWEKHRAMSPIAVNRGPKLREVIAGGRTEHPDVFAALADLRRWVDEQFTLSIAQLRSISGAYDLDLDSRISWNIEAVGFEPVAIRFELQRSEILNLLSNELYEDDPLAFLRELLQNSVDAIDMRQAVLATQSIILEGEINVRITTSGKGIETLWNDNGIGMDIDTLSAYFATLGVSWYRSRDAKRVATIEPISRFGVGILSCFAVTNQMSVQTRREPHSGHAFPGLSIEIPKRDRHFRVREDSRAPIGTTIGFKINPSLRETISTAAFREALVRIARFVRHRVKLSIDEVHVDLQSFETADPTKLRDELLELSKISGMRGDSAEKIARLTNRVTFEIGSPAEDYHGYYSAIIPKIPASVQKTNYREWVLDGETINFEDLLITREQSLFVKGIQSGPVKPTAHRSRAEYRSSSSEVLAWSDWINPTLLFNVRHPDYVDFNLARSSGRMTSSDVMSRASREIAAKLQRQVFPSSKNPAEVALTLGSCAVFGGISNDGLDSLIQPTDSPVLILRCEKGILWSRVAEFAMGDRILEAPFELRFANSSEITGFGLRSGLQGWAGADALVPGERIDSKFFPWLASAQDLGLRALQKLGWLPAEISLVASTTGDSLPLVCRIWKRTSSLNDPPWNILKRLYTDAPELLEFPSAIHKYAAFGSRWWNRFHPKIVRIVAVLSLLSDAVSQRHVSTDQLKLINYLCGDSFQGYVVPSRYSGVNLALAVPNRLLRVAKEAGLGDAEALVSQDFFPGTVNGYQNPYHYELSDWKMPGTNLGKPL